MSSQKPDSSNVPDSSLAMSDEQLRKTVIDQAEVWVIKVGSRALTTPESRLDLQQIENLSNQLVDLVEQGKQVVLVSSGAVASGVGRLGLPGRPRDLATLQAVAAVGQAYLVQVYEECLTRRGHHAAQVLLTASDLDDRVRYLNVRNTLHSLHKLGAIPIINENDTVAVDELKTTFGDNDRLAAMVAGLFTRPMLVILSDVRGLYDRDPIDPTAEVIHTIPKVDSSVEDLVRDRKTGVSKGGMASKLAAASFVTGSGQGVIIAWGREPRVLPRLADGELLGSLFLPQEKTLTPKKRWIGFSAQCAGSLVIDAGAGRAMLEQGKSLLPIGIREVQGDFEKGDPISILSIDGAELARGQSNYSSSDAKKIAGCRSDRIEEILGVCPYEEVVHRDNLVLSRAKT
ncbi:MAG: glutamate 5-kinase [Planctomycetota bacterium]|nr:glutamate 5-kinase [Planctomycetota bacterium]